MKEISLLVVEGNLASENKNFKEAGIQTHTESLKDTVQNLHAMKLDCIVMRHPVPGSCKQLTQYLDCDSVQQ